MATENRNRNRKPAWSDLPQELLSAIANSLTPNPLDILVFRSVCNSWRSSFPRLLHPSLLSLRLPFSVPRPPLFHTDRADHSVISVTVIYSLRRPLQLSPWILFLDEFTPGKVTLRKPFSLAPYSLPFNFPNTVNLVEFNACELGRFYNLSYLNDYSKLLYSRLVGIHKPQFCSEKVRKVVVLANDQLAGFALFDDGKLGMVRFDLGFNETGQSRIGEWEIIHDGKGFRFDDIVEFNGRVLGIDRRATVYEIGCHSSEMIPVIPPITGGGGRRKRLVESLGLLYLVVRRNDDPSNKKNRRNSKKRMAKFNVYELDEEMERWVEVTSLDDRILFFGDDFSFSASVQDLGLFGKNCILFRNRSFQYYNGGYGDSIFSESEISDLEIGVCHLNDFDSFGVIESFPGYSDILWPPPRWIWPICRLERLEKAETAIDGILEKITQNREFTRGQTFIKEETKMKALEVKQMVVSLRKGKDRMVFIDKLSGAQHGSRELLNKLDSRLEQARTSDERKMKALEVKQQLNYTRQDGVLFKIEEHIAVLHLQPPKKTKELQ